MAWAKSPPKLGDKRLRAAQNTALYAPPSWLRGRFQQNRGWWLFRVQESQNAGRPFRYQGKRVPENSRASEQQLHLGKRVKVGSVWDTGWELPSPYRRVLGLPGPSYLAALFPLPINALPPAMSA